MSNPHPDRLAFHLVEMGGNGRPEDLSGDFWVILQTLAQLARKGEQRLLWLAEKPSPLG
jgi:hypothetical protein